MRPLVLAWMLALHNVWRDDARYVAEFSGRPVVRRVEVSDGAQDLLARSFLWSVSSLAN